jgi:hypothetical protein
MSDGRLDKVVERPFLSLMNPRRDIKANFDPLWR